MPVKTACLALVCFASLLHSSTLLAQTGEQKFSDFATQIPKSSTQVFAINDLAGHYEAILRNKAFRRTLEEGAIGQMLGGERNVDAGVEWFEENENYFPATVAIAGSEDVYFAMFDIFHVLMRVNLAQQTLFNEEYDKDEYKLILNEMADLAEQFKIPDTTVWIQWSDQETTAQLFENFQQAAASVGIITQLKYKRGEDEFQISGSVADVSNREDTSAMIEMIGLEDPNGSITGALIGIQIFFKAELIDGGMRISIGSDPAGKPSTDVEDLVGFKDGQSEIAYGCWDGRKMAAAAKVFDADMERWGKSGLGKAFIANDIEDVWGTFASLVQQSSLFSKDGQMRVWAEKSQILANIRQAGMPEASTLVGSSILPLIPADSESYSLSSDVSFAETAFGWLERIEERMSTQSLRQEMGSDFETANAIDLILFAYYEHFGPMRSAITDLAEVPAVPFGLIVDSEAKLDSLLIDMEFLPEPIQTETDRFLRFAAISQVKDPGQMESRLIEIYEKFVGGVFSVNETRPPRNLKITGEVDLGSGVKGKTFSIDWADAAEIGLEVEGDIHPHVFIKDDFVVFSTSVELSQKILNNNRALKFAAVGENQSLVDCGMIKGVTVGSSVSAMLQLVLNAGNAGGAEAKMFAKGLVEISEIMNYCQWKTVQSGDVRNSVYTLDFKDK